LTSSSVREVAARAQVYLQFCEQKLASGGRPPAAKSAEEYYNLGVIDLNARTLDSALEHLSKADKLAPNQEHVRYALAAVHALQGNTDAALEHLRAAITLRPQNRARARRDEDFQSLVPDPRFRKL
jgi:tetratricopeptide (TPR) repeat protein